MSHTAPQRDGEVKQAERNGHEKDSFERLRQERLEGRPWSRLRRRHVRSGEQGQAADRQARGAAGRISEVGQQHQAQAWVTSATKRGRAGTICGQDGLLGAPTTRGPVGLGQAGHLPQRRDRLLRAARQGPRPARPRHRAGHAALVSAGEFVSTSGMWVNDRTHGLQFKATFLKAMAPTTLEGIEKYLGSDMIRGIGPVYAKKLVRAFGEAVFELIRWQPDRLREAGPSARRRYRSGPATWPRFSGSAHSLTVSFASTVRRVAGGSMGSAAGLWRGRRTSSSPTGQCSSCPCPWRSTAGIRRP
jgi:hypothetical protein